MKIINTPRVGLRVAIALRLPLGLLAGLLPCALPAAALPKLNVPQAPSSRERKLGTSFAPVAKTAAPSVVNIYSSRTVRQDPGSILQDPIMRYFFRERGFDFRDSRERRATSLGSGVILSADGYIFSNHHVAAGAEDIRVVLADGKEFEAKPVGSSRRPSAQVSPCASLVSSP